MSEETTEKFIAALRKLEEGGEVEPMVGLFAENAETGNVTLTETLRGKEGAKDFWTAYRQTFGEVSSQFHNKLFAEKVSALEWTTTGTSVDGGEIAYDGVSVLEFEGDKIRRFFAYFNPAKLGRQIEEGRAAGE